MHDLDEASLDIVLCAGDLDDELAPDVDEVRLDVAEGHRPVESGLAESEQVEVRSVQDGDPHFGLSPCNHELNCSMSSALRSAGSLAVGSLAGGGLAAGARSAPPLSGEKNWSKEKLCEARGGRGGESRKTVSSDSSPAAARVGRPVMAGVGSASAPPNACASADAAESSEVPVARLPNNASMEPREAWVAAPRSRPVGMAEEGPGTAGAGGWGARAAPSTILKSSSDAGRAPGARSPGRNGAIRAWKSRAESPTGARPSGSNFAAR